MINVNMPAQEKKSGWGKLFKILGAVAAVAGVIASAGTLAAPIAAGTAASGAAGATGLGVVGAGLPAAATGAGAVSGAGGFGSAALGASGFGSTALAAPTVGGLGVGSVAPAFAGHAAALSRSAGVGKSAFGAASTLGKAKIVGQGISEVAGAANLAGSIGETLKPGKEASSGISQDTPDSAFSRRAKGLDRDSKLEQLKQAAMATYDLPEPERVQYLQPIMSAASILHGGEPEGGNDPAGSPPQYGSAMKRRM